MDASTMAHRGFYDPEGRGEYARCPLKYSNYGGLHFISYSTTIARVVNDRNGRPVTLVSDFNYSMTTSKHLSCIRYASPHPVIVVPHCEDTPFEVFKDRLEGWQSVKTEDVWGHTPEDFLQVENRKKLLHLLYMFDYYQERVGGLDELLPIRTMGMVANWERLCLAIENKTMSRKEALEQAKEGFVVAQEEQRKIDAERDRIRRNKEAAAKRRRTMERKATEKQLGEAMTDPSILRWAFTYQSHLTEKEYQKQYRLRERLRKISYDIQNWGTQGASYVWVENDQEVKTSQGVTCKIGVVKRLASMWLQKCDIIGQDCDGYTVVMNNADFVKVGCHVIPVWNVRSLCKQLNIA